MQIMFCVFVVALGCWCYNLYVHRQNVHRIHYLMTALGVFKVLTLLAQCGMYHYIRITGAPDGWNIAFYIFSLFRGIFFFMVIILIGAGWSYMTPYLGENNKKILMLVIPLQVRWPACLSSCSGAAIFLDMRKVSGLCACWGWAFHTILQLACLFQWV
jgi:G protein-coupled receptor 107